MVHIGAQEEKNRLVAFLSRGEKKRTLETHQSNDW
jgi:hypothetical protein